MYTGPLYCYGDVSEVAAGYKEKVLQLGCSEEYATRLTHDRHVRLVRVTSTSEVNTLLLGRRSREV